MAKTKCVSLCLRYVIYMLFSLLFIFSLSQSAYTWGFGLQGRSPLRQSSTKLTLSTERGERGGAAAAPAGRKLPQEARAARSWGRAKTRCRRHALKWWFGSGEVSPDGLQGAQPPAMSALRVYIKNQSKRCIACSAMKVKTCFDTKCTPGQPFVIKFELLLNGAHP